MKVGFIGTGSMGSLLIDTFLRSGALEPCDVLASNRSQGKLLELQKLHPGLNVCASNCETASGSDIVFLCVKPLQFKALADEIAPCLRSEQIVVSITSPVQLQHLESVLPSKIAKIIPSITHSVRSGTSLCIFGSRLNKKTGCPCSSSSRASVCRRKSLRATPGLPRISPAAVRHF